MTCVSPLHAAIYSLPIAIRAAVPTLALKCHDLLVESDTVGIDHLFITGCGDSHHAGLAAALAFRQFSGLRSVTPLTAMQFARYQASFLPGPDPTRTMVIGISVSGQVSRTAEALELAALAGAKTLAITANPNGPLAQVAHLILQPDPPPAVDLPPDMILPGAGSYITSLLALYQIALRLGVLNGRLSPPLWRELQSDLLSIADHMDETVLHCDPLAANFIQACDDASHFVYCGSGPNYGTALFSAAKLLEASGDIAVAQDMEEWAHLEYFSRDPDTPTILISANDRDGDRALEIVAAARAIGRRLAIVAPSGSSLVLTGASQERLDFIGDPRECFSPMLACLPGLLLAAHRSVALDEPYFRGFTGGRSIEGGGGISRIRDSHRLRKLRP